MIFIQRRLIIFNCVVYREVIKQWPTNDTVNLDDIFLMTSFPQRRIYDLERTLQEAGT